MDGNGSDLTRLDPSPTHHGSGRITLARPEPGNESGWVSMPRLARPGPTRHLTALVPHYAYWMEKYMSARGLKCGISHLRNMTG
jgi:hypothetical protein